MKRNSKKLFKMISPFACLTAASVPLCITLTSCSASAGGLKALNVAQSAELPTSLNSKTFTDSSADIIQLLNGDKNYHEGNYCIILGSNTSQTSNKWFCGAKGGTDGKHYENYSVDNAFQGSQFLDSYELIQAYAKNNDCAMLTYLDIQTSADTKFYETVGEKYFPFDYKWTDQQQKDAEKWDEEHDTNLGIVKDHYARDDKSAKDMRSLVSLLHTLFGDTCKDITSEKLPFLMVWKKGVPQKDSFIQLTNQTNFADKVIEVWKKDDEKKSS